MLFLIYIVATIVALYYFKIYYINGGHCTSKRRLDGKTVIVTGSTSGIGVETARDLANRGAKVILAVRNLDKAKDVLRDITKTTGNINIRALKLDLSSLQSVAQFAKEFKASEQRLDILVNNAGIGHSEKTHTEDGIETVFQSNYLGHFLLTLLLQDMLKQSKPARVVNVSSLMYKFGKIRLETLKDKSKFLKRKSYSQSKLAQVISTRKLAKYFEKCGVTVYSAHPGYVKTEILSNLPNDTISNIVWFLNAVAGFYFGKTPKSGAQTTIYCAVQEGIEELSGCYFADCKQEQLKSHAMDDAEAEKLWSVSMDMISQYYKIK